MFNREAPFYKQKSLPWLAAHTIGRKEFRNPDRTQISTHRVKAKGKMALKGFLKEDLHACNGSARANVSNWHYTLLEGNVVFRV